VAFALAGTSLQWVAISIAVLVFNDVLNTSHVLEPKEPSAYTAWMKILDLVSFFLLGAALLSLSPEAVDWKSTESETLKKYLVPTSAWTFVAAYWCTSILWNRLAGQYREDVWPVWLKGIQIGLLVPLVVLALSPSACLEVPFLFVLLVYFFLKPANERPQTGGEPAPRA
jgi:hypothetical protein